MAEVGLKILPTADGNFLLLGSTESLGSGLRDIHLIKIDSDGNQIWEKTYGGALDDKPAGIIETSSSEFCIVGTEESFGSGGRDLYLVWVDQSGTLIQEASFGGSGSDGGTELIETETGDLMVFGYTDNYGAVNRDFYLMKLNSNGDSLWAGLYGGSGYEESHDLLRSANGDLLLVGHSASTDPLHNMYCVKVDANGNQIWEKNFGGPDHDGAHAAMINSDGNYVIVGRSVSFGINNGRKIYLTSCSPEGTTISEIAIGSSGDDWAQDILENESFYFIAGQTDSPDLGDDDFYLVKLAK